MNKIKTLKRIFSIFIFSSLIATGNIFAQETATSTDEPVVSDDATGLPDTTVSGENTENSDSSALQDSAETTEETAKVKNHEWFFTMGPILMINTESSTKSAPSPISFSCGLGVKFARNNFYSFAPRLSFFTNYYLWDGENALPAEVENRTATGLSFLLDLPIVFNIHKSEKSTFEIGGGLAVLYRYGLLSNGVESSDTGYTGDAAGDVSEINSWFMADMHYLYPELTCAWIYDVNRKMAAGFEAHVYFPLGSLANGRGIDQMMFQLAARIVFK